MEQHSLVQLQLLHPKIREVATLAYNEAVKATPAGVHPYIDQTYRTFSQSEVLYNQGRTTPGEIVTWALPGHSWHNWGLALDFHLQVNGKDVWPDDPRNDVNWMIVVNIFKSHGFNWGGDFPPVKGKAETDYPHLELKCGQTISGLLAKYAEKDFIAGTNYVNI